MGVRLWPALLADEHASAAAWLDEVATARGVQLGDRARTGLLDWIAARAAACVETVVSRPEPPSAFPAALRLVTSSVAAWRRRTADLFAHLVRDAELLGATASIAAITPHGERLQARTTTLGLELGTGARWMYRTRDRSQGIWFLEVCAALNAAGLTTPLPLRRLIARPGCSWDELVPICPCRDAGAVTRYFRRAGMLARLIERFDGVDFHARNMVAAGEYPVLVDVETLCVPTPGPLLPAAYAYYCSPLRSGFLGLRVIGLPGQPALDGGGLHPGGTVRLPFGEAGRAQDDHIAPTIPAALGDHVDDILAGWDEMEGVLASVDLGPLLERGRLVQRRDLRSNGRAYREALVGSLAPALLASEAARDTWLAARGFSGPELTALRDLVLPRPMVVVGDHPATRSAPPLTAVERTRRHDLIRTLLALRDDRASAATTPRALATARTDIAVQLGDRLLAVRFAGSDWHGVRWIPSAGTRILDVIEGGLYDGLAGLGVVFALLAKATGLPRFVDAVHGCLERVAQRLPSVGADGLGGAIYALARAGQLLRDFALVDRAQRLVELAPDLAPPWNVLTGMAGFVLGASVLEGPRSSRVTAALAALAVAHASGPLGPDAIAVIPGGAPSCVPAVDVGIACALARGGRTVQLRPGSDAPAWRAMLGEPLAELNSSFAPGDPLGAFDLAHARYRRTQDTADLAAMRAQIDGVVDRYRATGRWHPDTSIAERHQTSASDGLPALVHALLAAEDPATFSIRRLE